MKSKIQQILTKKELSLIKKLNTPNKVQNFLDKVPFNFEERGETYYSPRKMLKARKAHCFEGAMFAHLCLTYHNIENYILDLKVKDKFMQKDEDSDHILCIFKINTYWGAISKTNHSVLRSRDPIYKNVRELAMSFYHEYFLDTGEKTLKSFSKPFNIFKKFGVSWIIKEDNLDEIVKALDKSAHLNFIPQKNKNLIRKVGRTEIKGASVIEWQKNRKKV